jgi:hypothetical protein
MSDYPRSAGHKVGGASAMAAEKVMATGMRQTLRRAVMRLFETRGDWTPDEAANLLGYHPADIRPRFSELILAEHDRQGNVIRPAYLRKTRVMRLSARGNSQHVYEQVVEDV